MMYAIVVAFLQSLPPPFAKEYLHGQPHSIQLEVSDGRRWTVHCTHTKAGYVRRLTRGWNQFVNDNNLGEGDVCVFELIQVQDIVLKVSIFGVNEDTRQTNLPI